MLTTFHWCAVTIVAAAEMSELTILSMHGDRAFRPDPGTLCIVTELGDTLIFSDQPDPNSADCVEYELSSFLPEQNCWVISETFLEDQVIHLVNCTNGRTAHAVSLPEPSSDGHRLLCTEEDILLGTLRNSLQIWRVDPDSLVLEFQYSQEPWGPVCARWAGDSLILFDVHTSYGDREECTSSPGSLRLADDGIWRQAGRAD